MWGGTHEQRLDPKRERWINAAFAVVTVLVAVALGILAFSFAIDQKEIGTDPSPGNTARQSSGR